MAARNHAYAAIARPLIQRRACEQTLLPRVSLAFFIVFVWSSPDMSLRFAYRLPVVQLYLVPRGCPAAGYSPLALGRATSFLGTHPVGASPFELRSR